MNQGHTPSASEDFVFLAREFESLAKRLNESTSRKERTRLLRRMKEIIDEIDALIWNATLKQASPTPADEH